MAVDTQEMTNGTEAAESGKRKRVDFEALAQENPNEKVSFNFQVPAGMRVALKQAAERANLNEAEYARNALAKVLKYEIPVDFIERKGRRSSYEGMSEEEKKAAIAAQAASKRDNLAKLLEALATGAVDPTKLAELGIDVSALPKPRKNKGE